MKTSFNEQKMPPKVKAGDILATRSRELFSFGIRFLTLAKWSHVAIALDETHVLEAVLNSDPSVDHGRYVRKLSLEDFLIGKSKVLHIGRPHPISAEQKRKLHEFSYAQSTAQYTSFHAVITAALPITRTVCFALMSAVLYRLWEEPILTGTFTWPLLYAGLVIGLIIQGPWLVIWSGRLKLGDKWTEQQFRKFPLGIWLVNLKNEMFCSKLVVLADKEIGGPISDLIPIPQDAQPKHIVRACKKLDWKSSEL